MTLSEVEPRVKEHGQQFVGAKGSLQGAVAAVVSELLSEDKYTHAGLRLCRDILIMVLSSLSMLSGFRCRATPHTSSEANLMTQKHTREEMHIHSW